MECKIHVCFCVQKLFYAFHVEKVTFHATEAFIRRINYTIIKNVLNGTQCQPNNGKIAYFIEYTKVWNKKI